MNNKRRFDSHLVNTELTLHRRHKEVTSEMHSEHVRYMQSSSKKIAELKKEVEKVSKPSGTLKFINCGLFFIMFCLGSELYAYLTTGYAEYLSLFLILFISTMSMRLTIKTSKVTTETSYYVVKASQPDVEGIYYRQKKDIQKTIQKIKELELKEGLNNEQF